MGLTVCVWMNRNRVALNDAVSQPPSVADITKIGTGRLQNSPPRTHREMPRDWLRLSLKGSQQLLRPQVNALVERFQGGRVNDDRRNT